MRDKPSFLRLASSQGIEMSEAIAAEIRTICRRAAEPILAGETVKAQLRRAWTNLGRPPLWRLRAGWYNEAGPWSAAAVRDFQDRYRALLAREARRVPVAAHALHGPAAVTGPSQLEDQARAELRRLESRIAALESALRLHGPHMDGA